MIREPGSVVGTATRYGLEGPGIESRWGEIFRTYPDRLRGPPSLLYNGYRVFPGVKGGRGVMLTTHPLLVPRLRKSWAIPPRGELSYLAPLGSENNSAPYFKQCFFRGVWGGLPPRQSNTTPPSPKTEITNILFYILNFTSIIKSKM